MTHVAARALVIALLGCTDWRFRPTPDCVVGTTRPCQLACPGVQRCKLGKWAPCEAREPTPEFCNGLDDDCDEWIDYGTIDTGGPCSTTDRTCIPGVLGCQSGRLVCRNEVLGADEVCDGVDNDCNGKIDDGLNPREPADYVGCYTGPADALRPGSPLTICRPGWRICAGGEWTCAGEILPRARDCRSGLDNDCDGKPDGPDGDTGPLDLLLIVDLSGSMVTYDYPIRLALTAFARAHGGGTTHAALALAPGVRDGECTLDRDLDDLAALEGTLALLAARWDLGQEPSLDCPYEAATGEFAVSWRSGSRRVAVLLTDEEPQTYRVPPLSDREVSSALVATQIRLYVFTTSPHLARFAAIAQPTGGSALRLDVGDRQLEADLTSTLYAAVCQ